MLFCFGFVLFLCCSLVDPPLAPSPLFLCLGQKCPFRPCDVHGCEPDDDDEKGADDVKTMLPIVATPTPRQRCTHRYINAAAAAAAAAQRTASFQSFVLLMVYPHHVEVHSKCLLLSLALLRPLSQKQTRPIGNQQHGPCRSQAPSQRARAAGNPLKNR